MIGHFLLTLDRESENRVLTETFQAYPGGRCLLDVARNEESGCSTTPYGGFWLDSWDAYDGPLSPYVGDRYDSLCERFGVARINSAIRARILSNRARRVLGTRPEFVFRDCCFDATCADPRRHEPNHETTCPTCG